MRFIYLLPLLLSGCISINAPSHEQQTPVAIERANGCDPLNHIDYTPLPSLNPPDNVRFNLKLANSYLIDQIKLHRINQIKEREQTNTLIHEYNQKCHDVKQ